MNAPFSEAEENDLEELEQELTDAEISYGRMMKMYAEFLLAFIENGRFERKIGSTDGVTLLVRHLRTAITNFGNSDSNEIRKSSRIELLKLCSRLEYEQPFLFALVRCAVCCFYEEDGWLPDKEEDRTPIPLYLFLLKRLDSDMGAEFLAYARSYLLIPDQA